jgi:PAS domain S-box-containing protein
MSATKPVGRSDSSRIQPLAHEQSAHLVQFYEHDSFLLDELSRFIGAALGAGDAAVVFATRAHRDGLSDRLESRGFDTVKAAKRDRYISVDAGETLSKFMVNGEPNAERFAGTIGPLLARAKAAGEGENPKVAAFGEMVALLWAQGKPDAAVRLEQLWNDLAKTYSFHLWCGYPLSYFSQPEHSEAFLRICAEHSAVVPDESYMALTTEEMRLRNIAVLQQKVQALESERALRRSEERFRILVEAVQDYAIFLLEPNGCINSWNIGAERIKGYKPSEIIGQHFSVFYPEEDIRAGKPERELEVAVRDGRLEDEGWRIRKDGSRFWANVIITALRDDGGKLIGFAKVTRDFTERVRVYNDLQAARQKLEQSENSLRQLSRHLLRTQDEERRRIGRDLHDSLGQYLSALKMKLATLSPTRNSGITQGIAECTDLAEVCVKEVRTVSYLLYPPMLEEFGLKSAISWYLEGFAKRSGIQTTFNVSPDFERLDSDVELAMFRVLQESLTNVHRHSGSSTADVRLRTDGGLAILEISDHGKGIAGHLEQSGNDWPDTLGVGLRGMNERIRQLGGRLELSSSPQGTTVTAIVSIGQQTTLT